MIIARRPCLWEDHIQCFNSNAWQQYHSILFYSSPLYYINYIILYYILLYCSILNYVMLCYFMLCCVLFYSTQFCSILFYYILYTHSKIRGHFRCRLIRGASSAIGHIRNEEGEQ